MSPAKHASQAAQLVAEASGYSYAALWRGWRWLLAPLCDGWEGLSLNRFLAVGFGVAAVHGRLWHDVPITGWDVSLATLAGSLSFGKDVMLQFLRSKKDDPQS